MKATFDLLVVGEINPDIILRGADIVPAFGQVEKLVDEADLTLGASSVITACGAARLGLNVAFVGVVGDDLFGRFMLNALQERGIDTSHCLVDPQLQTGFTVILAKTDGDRAMLTFPGTLAALKPDQVDPKLLAQAKHLHVGSYFLLDSLRPGLPELFQTARARGVTTSLDTNWDPQGQWACDTILPYCDLLLPNEAETMKLASSADLETAVTKLAQTVPTLAVKCGADGGIGYQRGERVSLRPFPAQMVDTVGAGDSFNAGFLYGFIHHWPLKQSLQLALACGSLSTQATGGTTAQPTLEEALALIKKEREGFRP